MTPVIIIIIINNCVIGLFFHVKCDRLEYFYLLFGTFSLEIDRPFYDESIIVLTLSVSLFPAGGKTPDVNARVYSDIMKEDLLKKQEVWFVKLVFCV